ncbi:MAG: type VI secretion system baseplate subunit TssF [Granulosicoccus sp.]|nr:type VI secretion system baseplate subunit TssF [Granulosicoccus sp.]
MNPQLFELYRRELQHIREMGGDFAAEFPKVAGRLGLETLECSDPYVERLLEGFAFLAARVQLKIESSHSQLARQLLEMVYPTYLSPIPSMVINEVFPSLTEGSLAQGFTLERGTRLRSQISPDEKTECDFRTSHDLTLWPIEIAGIDYLGTSAALDTAGVRSSKTVRSGLSVQLKTIGGYEFAELPMDSLSIYLNGADSLGTLLYEQLFRHTESIALVCQGSEVRSPREAVSLRRQGYADDEALLPVTHRGFQGYRLIQEYFAFPERFLFARLTGLASRMKRCHHDTIEIVFLFDNRNERLFETVSPEHFRLNCVPAINLFPKAADRILLDRSRHRFHVIPDRTRPMDFEVYSVGDVTGFAGSQATQESFHPYFSSSEQQRSANRFYGLEREQRLLSSRQKRRGARASYVGSEVFISLVDERDAPYRSDLKQLAVETYCTNRDLPLQMPVGKKDTDFNLDVGAPVDSIRCIHGPTVPRPSRAHFKDAWRLVSNLNLNYLSLDSVASDDGTAAAAMLRQMLEMYCDTSRSSDSRQLEGILSVRTAPAVRQMKFRSHIEVARGMQVSVRIDEAAFEGSGAYVLGSVLEQFFARHATVNSFTETVLESVQRNEIQRWPVSIGQRSTL